MYVEPPPRHDRPEKIRGDKRTVGCEGGRRGKRRKRVLGDQVTQAIYIMAQ